MQVSRANLRCARSRRRRRLLFRYLGLVERYDYPDDEFERRLVEGDALESIGRATLVMVETRIDDAATLADFKREVPPLRPGHRRRTS